MARRPTVDDVYAIVAIVMGPTDLEPGLFIAYRRRRWFLFKSRAAGLGQIIGLDLEEGVVHLRVFWTPDDEDDRREGFELVAIGHLPIVLSQFMASSPEPIEKHPVPSDCWTSIATWRERHKRGEVGAFSVPLWKAVELTWETALEPGQGSVDDLFIETAFPRRGPSGDFNVLEVAARPRSTVPASTSED